MEHVIATRDTCLRTAAIVIEVFSRMKQMIPANVMSSLPAYCNSMHYEFVAPECELNVDKCVDGECTCKPGYLPHDCCDCAPGYYKNEEDGKCKCKI